MFRSFVAAATVACSVALVGCSSDPVATVTVPALWASPDGQSGVENATVVSTTSRDSASVTIDVSGEVAQGAGPAWSSASASAAATAILLSGVDPTTAGVSFGVTGPIDGPSAGGILTVGVLSGLLGSELDSSVTMTGTIAPDGSIGPISGVTEKVRAAVAAGFETILLPAGVNAEEGAIAPEVAEGKIQVVAVENIHQVWDAFTGADTARLTEPVPVNPAVEEAGRLAAERMLGRVPVNAEGREAAQDLLAGGDSAAAYGEAAKLFLQSEVGSALTTPSPTDQQILDLASEVEGVAAAALAGQLDREWSGSQRASLLAAATWLVRGQAVAAAARNAVEAGASSEVLRSAHVSLAYQRAYATAFFDDAVSVIEAIPVTRSIDEGNAARYLDAYLVFIDAAAAANQDYLEDVLGVGDDAELEFDPWLYRGTYRELAADGDGPVGLSPVAAATYEAAAATAEYAMSSLLVTAYQASYWLTDPSYANIDTAVDGSMLEAAAQQAADSMYESGERVYASGRDPSYFTWSTQWSLVLAQPPPGRNPLAPESVLLQAWPALVASAGLAAAPVPES